MAPGRRVRALRPRVRGRAGSPPRPLPSPGTAADSEAPPIPFPAAVSRPWGANDRVSSPAAVLPQRARRRQVRLSHRRRSRSGPLAAFAMRPRPGRIPSLRNGLLRASAGNADRQVVHRVITGRTMRAVADEVPPAFEVERVDIDGAPGLAVRGEVDVSVSPDLEQAVDSAIRDSVGAFVLDSRGRVPRQQRPRRDPSRAGAPGARRARARDCLPARERPPVARLRRRGGLLFLYSSREEVAADLMPTA